MPKTGKQKRCGLG